MLTVIAFVVLVILVVLVVYAIIQLALWPGRTARKREHPQADAINVLAWCGILLTAGVGWIIALTWAYARPVAPTAEGGGSFADLQARIAELEAQVKALTSGAQGQEA